METEQQPIKQQSFVEQVQAKFKAIVDDLLQHASEKAQGDKYIYFYKIFNLGVAVGVVSMLSLVFLTHFLIWLFG